MLEGAQAGLSWRTILNKRPAYRAAFDDFVPEIVAEYDAAKLEQLLGNPGIVRNRLKIQSAVANAKRFWRYNGNSAASTVTFGASSTAAPSKTAGKAMPSYRPTRRNPNA